MELQLELDDLASVRATIKEELQRARGEAELVELFGQVGQYQAAKDAYMQKVKLIIEGFFEVEKTLTTKWLYFVNKRFNRPLPNISLGVA